MGLEQAVTSALEVPDQKEHAAAFISAGEFLREHAAAFISAGEFLRKHAGYFGIESENR